MPNTPSLRRRMPGAARAARLTAAALLALSVSVSPALANDRGPTDEDGCFVAETADGMYCIREVDAKWGDYDRLTVKWRNVCAKRVYVRKCIQKENGTEFCGAQGVSAGNTFNWDTTRASGRYATTAVGSVNPGKDWVCAGKVEGWDDDNW